MIVVPVLMTSCHVSEKPNSGPVMPQVIIMASATVKVAGVPVMRVTEPAKRSKRARRLDLLFFFMKTFVDGQLLLPLFV